MESHVHELGIVFYIIDDAKKAAQDNGLTSVRRVTLQLGEVSGVVPELLGDAWKLGLRARAHDGGLRA